MTHYNQNFSYLTVTGSEVDFQASTFEIKSSHASDKSVQRVINPGEMITTMLLGDINEQPVHAETRSSILLLHNKHH